MGSEKQTPKNSHFVLIFIVKFFSSLEKGRGAILKFVFILPSWFARKFLCPVFSLSLLKRWQHAHAFIAAIVSNPLSLTSRSISGRRQGKELFASPLFALALAFS
jgi:hypothetical protein